MRRLSLTARLTLFYAVISALLLIGLGILVSVMVERHFAEQDADDLQDKLKLIQDVIRTSPDLPTLAMRLDDVVQNHRDLYVQLQMGSKEVYRSKFSPSVHFPLNRMHTTKMMTWRLQGIDYHGICGIGQLADTAHSTLTICAAIDIRNHQHFIGLIGRSLTIYILIATLIGGLLALWTAHSGLAPLRAMKMRAQAITGQRLDTQMPVDSVPVEMADLAESLNAMLERLHLDFRKLSEFSSDIAHELRTPITNLLTETQVAISQSRSADEYRDILSSNAEEFQRLARMVSDMLFLAKTEHGLVLPSYEQIAIEDEVSALFEFYDALAEERGISLLQNGSGSMLGDRLMLRRALSNILSNALRHTPPGEQVSVEIRQEESMSIIDIHNTGAEIPPDMLPRLFDRFFRTDSARVANESDGAGLGLAITRSIVEMHHGKILVFSKEGITCFSMQFPCPIT